MEKTTTLWSALLAVSLHALSSVGAPAQEPASAPFEFKQDDLVCLIGNTVVERAQHYAHIEAKLTLAEGAKNLRFRNLGWSGDTVFGDARSYFGPPSEGFSRLAADLESLRPTVVMTCYGSQNAFEEDPDADDSLLAGYATFLDMVEEKSGGARIVIISPPPLENLGAPLPDQTAANARLAKTRDRLREFAESRGAYFVDLFGLMGGGENAADSRLTENGVHYTDAGYKVIADKLLAGLGIDPVDDPGDALRDLIKTKNTLFFNRWRPANETYLHGFRKHEQGQNAKEMPEFDPLVKKAETEIAEAIKSLQSR